MADNRIIENPPEEDVINSDLEGPVLSDGNNSFPSAPALP